MKRLQNANRSTFHFSEEPESNRTEAGRVRDEEGNKRRKKHYSGSRLTNM